ncbi:hypothetical protein HN51_052270 [Arachis hypogaea]|uniref:BRI1 kinase inhibitor n=1 Tax=Arachis hypogaea TaxID=3818 RepID=A0A445CBA2_ARAHY|nr:BRI1 kinase inhibitor 1-like [Arachis ipaensis]XP_025668415.1 BRI1 kinase inhibitor 1 [Arachis hypogaea]QHN93590.1 BRI1 kinase inhibitor [Arachis hypogaea]RYR48234.1 hypothetical protein Ahy_A07g034239 isoform A [Arachis hypogaea]
METHHHQQHQKQIEARQEDKEAKQILLPKPSSPPPSQSSSPSHEFSFTISLHSSSTNKVPPPSLAIDLSPADEIFFHGHLLPLHLLSHLPSSPRFSTTSMESLTVPVPIRDFLLEDNENTNNKEISRSSCGHSNRSNITLDERIGNNFIEEDNNLIKRGTMEEESKSNNNNNNKHSSFSLFGLSKGRKVCQVSNKEELDKEKQQKRKLGFDVIHALKRLFRGRREREKVGLHESAYSSHSGNLMRKKKPELRGIRRGECSSAPASMRASPTNSGLLLATATTLPTSAANDSTMEELQAAIQAAIAHCKNSIAKEDNNLIKCTS